MLDDREQMIKEKLLEDLISKMSDGMGDRMKPKGLGVEVQAPDKEHLADGLDQAKSLLDKGGPLPGLDSKESPSEDSGDDEERMLQLLAEDDDDDDKKGA